MTLLLIDLDGFKLINDRYGHLAGDTCLRAVGDALRASVRELDRCFRWGGDEFAVLLLDSSEEETAAVAARIAERVTASAPLPDGSAPTLGSRMGDARARAWTPTACSAPPTASCCATRRVTPASGASARSPPGASIAAHHAE